MIQSDLEQKDSSAPIAILVSSMRSGGAERVALNLSEEFSRRGLDVDLVLVSSSGPLLRQVPPRVKVVNLNSGRARRAVFRLRQYLKRATPQVLIAVAFENNLLAAIATLGLRKRPRLIFSVHSTFTKAISPHPPLKRLCFTYGTRLLYKRAHRVVAVSHGAAADLIASTNIKESQVVTIYNPVIRRDFDTLAGESVDHPWISDPHIQVIVSAGRISMAKDYNTLLRAFAKIVRTMDVRLIVLGDGEMRREIEDLASGLNIRDMVDFRGTVENPYAYMSKAELFVLSSAWEGFGNVLVEAMAAGVPVISTDCPHGPREILEDGRWGKLVPVGDVCALAAAMKSTLETGDVTGRARAMEFTVEQAADRYLAIAKGMT